MERLIHLIKSSNCSHKGKCLIALFTCVIILNGFVYLSFIQSNLALIFLNSTLGHHQGISYSTSDHAEELFRLAISSNSNNRTAWRGLGILLLLQNRDDEARIIWRATENVAEEFLSWGEQARYSGDYKQAHEWHDRVIDLKPEWSDPWYFKALVFQNQERWEDVLLAYAQATELNNFRYVHVSDVYFNQGLFYQQNPEYRDLSLAIMMYNQAIHLSQFSSRQLQAETFYKRGEVYGWVGRDPAELIDNFQQAIYLAPNHHWARLRLGYAIYSASEDVETAVAEIEVAIKIWPKDSIYRKWPYRYLGDIYHDAGLITAAIIAYEEVLRIDPYDEYAYEMLSLLLEDQREN
jgi:tetratricopeptide (TPR) repeat protein